MEIFSTVQVKPINPSGTAHEVLIDGVQQKHVSHMDISFDPNEIPHAVITLNSIADIDEDMAVTYKFEPSDIRERIRFLALQLQLDKDLHDAWQSSIYSALKDLRAKDEGTGDYICDYDRAGYILDRLME